MRVGTIATIPKDLREGSFVRILRPNGTAEGVGFMVSDRHILTCAHVVQATMTAKQPVQWQPPAGLSQVWVNLALVDSGKLLKAELRTWGPQTVEHRVRGQNPPNDADWALLEIVEDYKAAKAVRIDPGDAFGHPFWAFGITSDHPVGTDANGIVGGGTIDRCVELRAQADFHPYVSEGFSGAAVWSRQSGAVVGMIVALDPADPVMPGRLPSAYMIPIASLQQWLRPIRPGNQLIGDAVTYSTSAPSIIVNNVTVAHMEFDLWTPGQLSQNVLDKIEKSLGEEIAQLLRNISGMAIQAIGFGDFLQQQKIAEHTIEIGEQCQNTSLLGEGYYLKGEALRLQADFAPSRAQQRILRQKAEQFYGMAEDALGGDPRAIRGRARIIELEGDLDSAFNGYQDALAAIDNRTGRLHEGNNLSLIHERIRTLRHKIVCLSDIQKDSFLISLETQRRANDIRRLLEISEIAHDEGLRLFAGQGEWICIEWFASSVLHAKGWVEIREPVYAAKRLVTSLEARLKMLPRQGPLSVVELGNLQWWARAAREVRGSFDPAQQAPLAVLLNAIDCDAERPTVHQHGANLLLAGRPFVL